MEQGRVGSDEAAALREENARLRAQLAGLVAELGARSDVDLHVDLEDMAVRVGRAPIAHAEAREVAERLAHVQRDLRRIEQLVERLLWRVGEPAAPLAHVEPS